MASTEMIHHNEKMKNVTHTLSNRAEIIAVVLFGSHARGRPRRTSDVDIALYVDDEQYRSIDRALPYGYRAWLSIELSRILSVHRVDVIILNEAPLELANEILRHGKLLFCRDRNRWYSFVLRVKHRYADMAPWRKRRASFLRKKFKKQNGPHLED